MRRLVTPRILAWSFPVLSLLLVAATLLVAFQASGVRADSEFRASLPLVVLPLVFPTVGVLIARRDPSNPVGWLFCIVGAAGGAILAGGAVAVASPPLPGRDWATWATEWLYAGTLGALALVLLYFPNGRLPSRRWRVVDWLLALGLGVLIVSVTFRPRLPTSAGIGSPLRTGLPARLADAGYVLGWSLVWVVIVASAASLVVRFASVHGVQRQQLKWLTLATCLLAAVGVLTIAANFLGAPDLERSLQVLFGVALLAIPVTVGIAILRHRLYDIDLLINRTLIYGLVTVTLGIAYAATALLLGTVLGPVGGGRFTSAAATLVAAAVFQPARRRIQVAVDRRFNRHKYDAAKTIAAFSARLRQEVDLGALTAELEGVVNQTMQPARVLLWLRPMDPAAETPPIEIAAGDPLPAAVQELARAVDLESLRLDSAAGRDLRAAGIELVVPLISQGELIGLLNLGPRRGERSYSADDRALLGDLAGHAAPALRLTQLVRRRQEEARELERIDRELHVAQLIQQRFLPREPPELPGWRLAAFYGPARAVGGDFYDFIPLAGGRMGIVVGDVTDKGVPAALVMATTHAILRAEAPKLATPAQVLGYANDVLVKETFEHMFVTCLYAVLDPASGELRFANAGHNLPYLRGEGGVVELRATGMPLGLLPGSSYEETTVTVAPGEDLLLYSDGLTEAHGPGGEMFGFPRVAKLVADRAERDGLIDLLRAELARFTGPGWEQEDDITLVTLQRAASAAEG